MKYTLFDVGNFCLIIINMFLVVNLCRV